MPRSAATCAIGRSLSSANRTPRSSNSSGYFLGLDMTAEDLLPPGQHPGSEVPAKPGPAQFAAWRQDFAHRVGLGASVVVGDEGEAVEVGVEGAQGVDLGAVAGGRGRPPVAS